MRQYFKRLNKKDKDDLNYFFAPKKTQINDIVNFIIKGSHLT